MTRRGRARPQLDRPRQRLPLPGQQARHAPRGIALRGHCRGPSPPRVALRDAPRWPARSTASHWPRPSRSDPAPGSVRTPAPLHLLRTQWMPTGCCRRGFRSSAKCCNPADRQRASSVAGGGARTATRGSASHSSAAKRQPPAGLPALRHPGYFPSDEVRLRGPLGEPAALTAAATAEDCQAVAGPLQAAPWPAGLPTQPSVRRGKQLPARCG